MKSKILTATVIIVFILLLLPAKPASASGPYWFQVGVFMKPVDSVNVTGASVQIRTHVPPYNPNAYTSYWVGLDLPNYAFIQVGYVSWPSNGGYPKRFWEYFPPKGDDAGGGFHGDSEGQEVGPNGTWYTYSLESKGKTWYAYVNGIVEGSYDLGSPTSADNTPYAVAEVEGAYVTNIPLGPVEFRDLAYRDTSNIWHNVSEAVAWMGYGLGSGTLPAGAHFPYGLEVIGVNDWIAGIGLPTTYNNTSIWTESSGPTPVPTPTLPLTNALIVLGTFPRRRNAFSHAKICLPR